MHFAADHETSTSPTTASASLTTLPKPLVGSALAKHAPFVTTVGHNRPAGADSSASSGDNEKNNKTDTRKYFTGRNVGIEITTCGGSVFRFTGEG